MRQPASVPLVIMLAMTLFVTGCKTTSARSHESSLRVAIEQYTETQSTQALASRARSVSDGSPDSKARCVALSAQNAADPLPSYFTLGMMPDDETQSPDTQPAAIAGLPEGYWRKDVWHQMGHEFRELGTRELWHGFKTSFWDVENALLLTAAMGASVTIRETGVDDAIRRRTHGHRQLGDGGEAIGVLGNPATHLAGTGVLWLASTLTKDAEQHEVAKALAEALSVTGITTLGLKFTVRTREPDGSLYGWPSGHTASTVAVAAVLDEYYGHLVGIPCYALAGLVGYERIDSREHDLSDVVFGAMLGYVVGSSIARDEKAQFPELWGMKVVPYTDVETGTSGLALMKSW